MLSFQTVIFFVCVIPYTIFMSILSILGSFIDRSGRAYWKVGQIWSQGCLWLLGIRVKIYGKEKFDPNGTYVVASNHASMADIPIILACIQLNLRMIAKAELAAIPFLGWSLWFGDFILIDRKNHKKALEALIEAKEKLSQGKSVHFFADGTRDVEGKIQPLKQGSFKLACESNVPVLPVTILGSHKITDKKSLKIYNGEVRLLIDTPIFPNGNSKVEVERLRQTTYRQFLQNHSKYADS